MSTPPTDRPETPPSATPPLNVLSSIASAAFGVQSSRKSARDFTQGRFRHYVIGAVSFVALFIASVISLVHLVLGAT